MSARSQARSLGLALAVLTVCELAVAIDGPTDRNSPFIVAVAVGAPSNPALRCSGVLIDPEVVMTVRHCVETSPSATVPDCKGAEFGSSSAAPEELWVSSVRDIHDQTARWHQVRSTIVPQTNEVCGADIALLLLEQPVPDYEAYPVVPVVSATAFDEVIDSGYLGAVGYGRSSNDSDDSGVRRARWDVPLRCVRGNADFPCVDEVDYAVPWEFVSGPASCIGDSGSGAVDQLTRQRVFGVLSRGMPAPQGCQPGVYERTDAWSWLLASTVLEVAERRGGDAPDWARSLFPTSDRVAEPGDYCRSDAECSAEQSCLSGNRDRSFVCAASCQTSADCSEGFGCVAGESGGHCFAGVPRETPERAGCSLVDPAPPRNAWPFVLMLGIAGARATRQRWSRGRNPSRSVE